MEPTVISLPWLEVGKIVLSAGVITALVNQSLDWFRVWRKDQAAQKRDASFSALRIAVILEKFAAICAQRIGNNQLYIDSHANAGDACSKIPLLDEYPEDMAWKDIDQKLAAQVLSFANEITMCQSIVDGTADVHPDLDTIIEEYSKRAGGCGYRGWVIAKALREKYNLPPFKPEHFSWDIAEWLKKHHDDAN